MILRIEEMQNACGKFLAAVDSNNLSILTETLKIKTEGRNLYISVTNREYFAKVRIEIDTEVEFHATVNANLFLKLISQITTDTIELNIVDNSLVLKGNGTYKLPLIYDGDKLLELPEINIYNPTVNFVIKSETLLSILQYNSKELTKGVISKPVQKLYYVDELGAITFTNGACVNSFSLTQPIKVLFNNRLVKLFKLFKDFFLLFCFIFGSLFICGSDIFFFWCAMVIFLCRRTTVIFNGRASIVWFVGCLIIEFRFDFISHFLFSFFN
jgi:hypothetical protein